MVDEKRNGRGQNGPKPEAKPDKKVALGKALRENLQRRKAQARARKSSAPERNPD